MFERFGKTFPVISTFITSATDICEVFPIWFFFVPRYKDLIYMTHPLAFACYEKVQVCWYTLKPKSHGLRLNSHTQHQTFWQMINKGLNTNRLHEDVCNATFWDVSISNGNFTLTSWYRVFVVNLWLLNLGKTCQSFGANVYLLPCLCKLLQTCILA